MRFSHVLACAALGGAARICCADVPSNSELQEVVVTASLRPVDVQQVPASVTVLDAATLQAAGEQHFEDVIALVPNLNWAGDTSRPRYFQVRGVGELEQYQGAPNPSVGFLIDDIDFSGLGTAATLFDVDRIEVLRGPQGTRYGANALGGLIYVQSAAPEPQFDGHVELGAGDYGGRTYGAVLTGPIPDLDSGYRVGVQHDPSGIAREAPASEGIDLMDLDLARHLRSKSLPAFALPRFGGRARLRPFFDRPAHRSAVARRWEAIVVLIGRWRTTCKLRRSA